MEAEAEKAGLHCRRRGVRENAWIENLDANGRAVRAVVGARGYWRWSAFLLACSELWGYRGGAEWLVSDYVLTQQEHRGRR